MKKNLLIFLFTIVSMTILAQGQVKGLVMDKGNSEALSYVSVALMPQGSETPIAGTSTDATGHFHITGINYGTYTLTLTFVGYKTVTKQVVLNEKNHTVSFAALYMTEDANVLNEVQVTGQRSTMKLEVGRKSFDVAGMITSAGLSAS